MNAPEPMQTSTPMKTENGSWGAIISILLILGIVVAGAYYAFTDRITPPQVEEVSS